MLAHEVNAETKNMLGKKGNYLILNKSIFFKNVFHFSSCLLALFCVCFVSLPQGTEEPSKFA